jgi:acetoacetyl-CoA synthetase
MLGFLKAVEQLTGQTFQGDYLRLHRWACENIHVFWQFFLEWTGVPSSGSNLPAFEGEGIEDGHFFPNLRLNYAECLLRPLPDVSDELPAVVFRSERGEREEIGRATLRRRVLSIAAFLKKSGVTAGDRVVAFARNTPDTVQACLASAAIGATWSSVGLDLAPAGVLSRFQQLEPVVLFAHTELLNHGVCRPVGEQLREIVAGLPSLRLLVLLGGPEVGDVGRPIEVVRLESLQATEPLLFEKLERFPFDHPLFVLFSSGTTGPPKCIVHGAGGTLLEHLKEHRLHSDLRAGERLYFHTSCGWMMWNWQLSAIASGVSILLYDGSVSYPDATALLKILDQERVTVFGTSPAYIQLLRESGIEPRNLGAFTDLRAIQSTGSILYDEQFDWIRDFFKAVPIHSISGGSDIIGCFVLGNPLLPVYRGESQSLSLGLDVRVLTDAGIERTGTGELLCAKPFPSRPVFIWGDAARTRFHDSYFAENAGYWTHGDLVELAEPGSARVLGRSDGTMKIRGVRIGPAEIYVVVLGIPGIREAMAVEQEDQREPGGRRIVLLLVLAEGKALDREFTLRIKREISKKASSVHVPSVIVAVSGLPQTHNGKYSERAAKDVVNGRKPKNLLALRNPACLEEIERLVPPPG